MYVCNSTDQHPLSLIFRSSIPIQFALHNMNPMGYCTSSHICKYKHMYFFHSTQQLLVTLLSKNVKKSLIAFKTRNRKWEENVTWTTTSLLTSLRKDVYMFSEISSLVLYHYFFHSSSFSSQTVRFTTVRTATTEAFTSTTTFTTI